MGDSDVDVDVEAFLCGFILPQKKNFTSAEVVRALAAYTGASLLDISSVVDMTRSHHTFEKVREYAMELADMNRGCSEEKCRMTVMLPTNHELSDNEKPTWKNANCPSPSPSDHCTEQNKKICKQFQANGGCTFGSRCLYHHVRPQQRGSSPHALGIIDRCVNELQNLKPPGETVDMSLKGKKRELFAALPSSTNNYSLSPRSFSGVADCRETFVAPQRVAMAEVTFVNPTSPVAVNTNTSSSGGGLVMVPLSLPNGAIYGYAPFHLQMPPSQSLSQ